MKTVASAISDRGLLRDGNEDQYLIDESLGLFVVCDGMGGHSAGEVASERAIHFAAEHMGRHTRTIETAASLPDGFFRVLKLAEEAVQVASEGVSRLADDKPEFAGMGTTMTMLVIVEDKGVMAHVGDSRLYLMRDGGIHQLSEDHTLANEMVLCGQLTRKQALTSRYQHFLTRCVGRHEGVSVDTLLFDLLPGDRFLLCSDGLSNYFDDEAVVARFLAEPMIVEHPDSLIDFAKDSGGSDNITAVVIESQPDSDDPPNDITKAKLQCLQQTFLGSKLSAARLLHLLSISKTIHCGAGNQLIGADESCKGLYAVMSGQFRVLKDGLVESRLGPGDWFGEASLAAPTRSPATIVADEPSQVLLIDRKHFNVLVRRWPRLGKIVLRNLARRLSERIVELESRQRQVFLDTEPL